MRLPLLAALLAAASPAGAGTTTFGDAGAFTAAAGALAREGFERCVANSVVITGPLDRAAKYDGDGNVACAAGAIRPGIRFIDDPGPDQFSMFLAAPGFTGNATTALGQGNPAADGINLDFDAGVRAVGFTLIQSFGGGEQLEEPADYAIELYAGTMLLDRYMTIVPPGEGVFWGVLADGPAITRVRINNPRAFDVVDDILFSADALDTPAPATAALLALGALALARRRAR